MKKIYLILLCILFTTGCAYSLEMNKIGIVMTFAIDKDVKNGDIIFTTQVIRPGALSKENVNNTEAPVEIFTTKGRTMYEAIQNLSQVCDRKSFYAHTKVIVIGEELAKEGVTTFLDFFVRGRELRGYTWICVAKGCKASEVLGVKNGIDTIQAVYLKDIIENRKHQSKTTTASVIDFYRKALNGGIEPTMGVFELIKEANSPIENKGSQYTKVVKLTGSAVFNKDKLVGYLDERETRGLNFIRGGIREGIVIVPSLLKENGLITLKIKNVKSSIKPEIKNKKISFNIKINVKAILVEEKNLVGTDSPKEVIEPKQMLDYLKKIKKEANESIDSDIKLVLDKSQKDLKSDIFGFGSILNKKYPNKWNMMQESWSDTFSTVNYTTKVSVSIIGTDLKQGVFEVK